MLSRMMNLKLNKLGMMQILIQEEEMRQRSNCGVITQVNAVMTLPVLFSPQDHLKLQRTLQRKLQRKPRMMMDWAGEQMGGSGGSGSFLTTRREDAEDLSLHACKFLQQ